MRRIAALLFVYFFACPLFAQSGNATLTGFIQDSSKAFISGAAVIAVNTGTNESFEGKTGRDGSYNIVGLPAGPYRMEVEKPAFKTIVREGMILHVQDTLQVNFEMAVGSTSESVTVDGSGINVNTTDGSVSTVVDRKFVENMPLNGRSFQDLISMTPGVVTASPQTVGSAIGSSGDFSVNGQRTESNSYLVDGVSANSGTGYPSGAAQNATGGTLPSSTVLGTTQSLLSIDAMQEFRLESSTYSAEYGRSPGGQISLLSRSGTTTFHGSAYDYLRNSYFDANDWFNDHYGRPATALRQNDFGGTLGGPIPLVGTKMSPAFFFFSYEGLRLAVPQPASIQYVPDASIRQNASPNLKPILNAFPLPTPGGIDYGALAQFISTYSVPGRIDSTSVRLDKTLSSKITAFFRFADTPSSTQSRVLSSLQTISGDSKTYTAGATVNVARCITDEARFGYTSNESDSQSRLDNFGGAQSLNLRSTMGLLAPEVAYADVYLYFAGTGTSSLGEYTSRNSGSQWNLVNTISVTRATHHYKFGVDFRHISSPLTPSTPYVLSQFSSLTSLINDAGTVQVQKSIPSTPVFTEFAAYAADEWKVLPRFSLSLGLRWEVNPPPTNSAGGNAYTLLGNIASPSSLTLAPQGTPLWRTTYYNFAPRIGGAWQAFNKPGRETVVRGGGGVFFDTDNVAGASGFSGLGFSSYTTYTNASLPITAAQQAFTVTANPATGSVYAFPSHLQLPYTLQWSAAVEQSLGRSQSLTLSYLGSNGRRLIQNQVFYLGASNPAFSYVYAYPTGVTSNYQALQLKAQRSIRAGVNALVSYTWSHSIDFGSSSSALPLTRGNSDFDVRNNLQAGMSWDLPAVHGGEIKQSLLSGFGMDGRFMTRTGFPVTLAGNTLFNPATGYYSTNVNLIPGQPIYLYGPNYPGGRAINRAAFAVPTGSGIGNAPRNFVRGFGATQLNVAVRKDFRLFETASLQFRAEAFNVLNHPMFGLVDSATRDATFGQATKTLSQSLGTVSSLYQQGGPRSMQFALKLKF